MILRLSRGGPRRAAFYAILLLFVAAVLFRICILRLTENDPAMVSPSKFVVGPDHKIYEYNRDMPLIFIGGVPRSGTTLMRAMLDAHPDVRCGQETRVIPRLLQLRFHWLKSEKESLRLEEAGITKSVLDSAIAAFTLEIIVKHGEPAPRLCNKDPLTIKMGTYVVDLFPNAKFIFMVRDGRATAHSIITRKVTITGFDLTSYRQCLKKWNSAVEAMNNQCKELGPNRCLKVPYEQLVLHPRKWMEKVLKFLDIPWNESVLHHHEFINNGVSLSKVERSSDQVIKPVNLEALTKWVGSIPDDVVKDMAEIAPMLSVLGYDPYANPPNYGRPDDVVATNTKDIQKHKGDWEKKAKEMFNNRWEEGGGGDTALDKEPSDNPNNTT
ncbi:protein-tyrosine sulfotransferase [Tribolium castaneum]|uniref:Protein-tyrosine sulfotransferase n=1 Tax=Tribolium castaneum TaxID=7070 RepID=D6X260_TRICA|nr:PREDICTED: protein-tyrosine sulfotransferase [Tribolium castaneum]XP_968004.1 PREDICTED: protein-tyrosine sulfotransferase [Tribolium castaneum]EFA09909.1 Protein-tyrosine sulfotransferase-like Protein [Tribolium castaneum]|eukprot:XP_008197799.1 PREDICTED: protein-tyrosine sulfotransferase [Tribolium castaneum]